MEKVNFTKGMASLKIVVSNPPHPLIVPPKKTHLSSKNSNTRFISEIVKKGNDLYTLFACDPIHYLDCEIPLQICREDGEFLEEEGVTCNFPNILGEELNEIIEGDETLYGIIIIQFQMKILEQLLSFCKDHDVLNLLIYTDDTYQGHALKIYNGVVKYQDKIPIATGIKVKLSIPINQKTFDKWEDIMRKTNENFRQTLWMEQSTNPIIRYHLKLNSSLYNID